MNAVASKCHLYCSGPQTLIYYAEFAVPGATSVGGARTECREEKCRPSLGGVAC
jgi:hypothetical protein